MAEEFFDRYDDLDYLGSIHDNDLKDYSDSYPVHIKNQLNARKCRIYMSLKTFKFKTVDNGRYKEVEVKLKDIQHERIDHKNNILTVVAKTLPEYSYGVHYFFSFISPNIKKILYTPFKILEVS